MLKPFSVLFLPCLPPLKGLGSASRSLRNVLSISPRVLMAAILFTLSSSLRGSGVLFLGRIWEATAEGVEKVSECMTSCSHGGQLHIVTLHSFLGGCGEWKKYLSISPHDQGGHMFTLPSSLEGCGERQQKE